MFAWKNVGDVVWKRQKSLIHICSICLTQTIINTLSLKNFNWNFVISLFVNPGLWKPRVVLADYFCIPPTWMRILRVTQSYPEKLPSFDAIYSKPLGISNSRLYPGYLKLCMCWIYQHKLGINCNVYISMLTDSA